MKKNIFLIALMASALCSPVKAQEWKSVDDPSLPKEERVRMSDYEVSIRRNGDWEKLDMNGALVSDFDPGRLDPDTLGNLRTLMGFCMFTDEFRKPVKIRVKRQGAPFHQVDIRPVDYKIKYKRIDDQTIELTLRNPRQKISVEYDGDREHNLFLIPDLPDRNIQKGGAGVRYYGPGEHDAGLLELHSGETLYVDEGATLYATIRTRDAENIRVAGRGIICSSKAPHHMKRRSSAFYFENCKNLTIEGVMLRDSPAWTLHLANCENVLIDNMKQICWMANSDGIDLCNVRHAEIRNCFLRNWDDNISLKNPDWGQGGELFDIRFHDNTLWADRAHNMLVGPESRGELGMRDIHFDNIQILEGREKNYPFLGTCAVMIADNGHFHDISFTNITVDRIRGGQLFQFDYCVYRGMGRSAGNILLKNIRYNGEVFTKSTIRGLDATHTVDGITLQNISINGKKLTKKNLAEYVETNEFIQNMEVK